MTITKIEAIPILVPLKSGMTTKTAHGEHIDSPYVIIRIHTHEGIVGLGEATLSPRWSGETSTSCVSMIQDLISPLLEGSDPRDVTALLFRMERVLKLNPFTKAAVEMALWDLAGKAANQPVYRLFGGKVRNVVPIKMVIGAFGVEKSVALAEQFLNWGVRCLKVKVGLDPREDFERVVAVREAVGSEVKIGIDANCGWNQAIARQILKSLEPYDILFAEQPIPPGDLKILANLRETSIIPIMADESVFSLSDAWNLTQYRAADVLSLYPGKNGSLTASRAIANIAEAAGLVCHLGSNLELGIASAAMLHLAVALPTIDSETYPADIIGPLYHEADMICNNLNLGPVVAKVPEGPGLGVELDEEQVERWRKK